MKDIRVLEFDFLFLQVQDNAMTGTVCTLFELQNGDDSKNQGR